MTRRLLLISNSTNHGEKYLEHCEAAVRRRLTGCSRLTFVPYALADHEGYAAKARARFGELGIEVESVHETDQPAAMIEASQAVFVGGGNTFRLLSAVTGQGLVEPLRRRVAEGMPYLGASAGTNLACPTVRTTNDMPIVEPPSLTALGLIPFQINPHYLDPLPGSTHMGETRETRLLEYLEENTTPVVGLREGCFLEVDGDRFLLGGAAPARWFVRGRSPQEIPPGSDLADWLP